MRRLAGLVSGVALFLLCSGPALAQGGAGLYEPFPEPSAPSVSRSYIEKLAPPGPRLAQSLSADQLARGARVPASDLRHAPPLPAATAPGPTDRAEPGDFAGSAAGWLAVAALLAGVAFTATRRLAPA